MYLSSITKDVMCKGFINRVDKWIPFDLNVRTYVLTLYRGRYPWKKNGLAVIRKRAAKDAACFFCNHDVSELPLYQ